MSQDMIAALIGAGVTLLVTVITKAIDVFMFKHKDSMEFKQMEHQLKKEKLDEVYKNLISAINFFPDMSPNDVLNCVEYSPHYSMESFDSVLKSLDYQIEDYKKKLEISNMDYEQKSNIETQISNREYSKKKISEIRDKYYTAKDKYRVFCESDKVIFDLYAGQNVRNCLIEFEVVIHNVFISGYSVGDAENPINNIMKMSRQKLIDSMRYDIGIM